MKKYWVFEVSKESQDLFRSLAEEEDFSEEDIQRGLDSKIHDLHDTAYELGFRICENKECHEFHDNGYMTEHQDIFCSRECVEDCIDGIEEEDYGTDTVFWTHWYD